MQTNLAQTLDHLMPLSQKVTFAITSRHWDLRCSFSPLSAFFWQHVV